MPRSANAFKHKASKRRDVPDIIWDDRFTWILAGHPKRLSVKALTYEAKLLEVPIKRWGKLTKHEVDMLGLPVPDRKAAKLFWVEGHTKPVERLKHMADTYMIGMARLGTLKITKLNDALWSIRYYTKEDCYET